MGKTIFIIKEMNEMYRVIEYHNGKRNEKVSNQNEMNQNLYKYEHDDLIIHDIPTMLLKPTTKLKATNINVIEAFGCDWQAFFTQFKMDDIIDSKINKFAKYNLDIPASNPIYDFSEDLKKDFGTKSFFGNAADYHQYTFDIEEFYKFLSVQIFPNPKHVSLKKYSINTKNPESFAKFILALHMYEGFAICNSLISDDIQLDELNIFEKSNEIIIPFNLLKYLIKEAGKSGTNRKGIGDLTIREFYVTTKKKLNFSKELNSLEKTIQIGGYAERSDIFTKMYVRYYFFIFSLKYFKEDIISIDLKRKIIHTYNKDIRSKLFHAIK